MDEKVKETVREIIDQREEILRAFVAKYECGPEEIVQVMQRDGNDVKFCVRKKDQDEADMGGMDFFLRQKIEDCAGAMRVAALGNDRLKGLLVKMRMEAFREIREEMKKRTVKIDQAVEAVPAGS